MTIIRLKSDPIIENGVYYGYPKCCIEEFFKKTSNGERPTEAQIFAGASTGFIPCEQHSKLINQEEISLEDLISNKRKSKFPFPHIYNTDLLNFLIPKSTKLNKEDTLRYLKQCEQIDYRPDIELLISDGRSILARILKIPETNNWLIKTSKKNGYLVNESVILDFFK